MKNKSSLEVSTDARDPITQLETIFSTIEKTLRSYEEMNTQNQVMDQATKRKFQHAMVAANDSLDSTEGNTFSHYKSFEEITNWISDIRYQQDTFFQMNVSHGSNMEMGNFMLTYNENSNHLREMQNKTIKKLRTIIETYETPQSTRLTALKAEIEHSYETRLSVIKSVTKQMDETSEHLIESAKKNEYLLYEMEKTEKELLLFGDEKSYELLLKARKQKLLEKEWEIKKAILINDIDKAQKDLESFRNSENTTSELKKLINEQESEIKQLVNHYNEEIRQVETEISIDSNSHKSTFDQINKELNNSRNDHIKQERFETMGQLKSQKTIGDRTINGIKKRRMATLRNAEKKLKKCKDIEQSMEIASTLFDIDKTNSSEICEAQIAELKEILKRVENCFIEDANVKIKEIERSLEQTIMICKANNDRFAERTVQRELENDSVNRNIVLLESMISDLNFQLNSLQKEHDEKERMLQEIAASKESKIGETSVSINKCEEFIKRAKIIIESLQINLVDEVDNEDTCFRISLGKRPSSSLGYHIDLSKLIEMIDERAKRELHSQVEEVENVAEINEEEESNEEEETKPIEEESVHIPTSEESEEEKIISSSPPIEKEEEDNEDEKEEEKPKEETDEIPLNEEDTVKSDNEGEEEIKEAPQVIVEPIAQEEEEEEESTNVVQNDLIFSFNEEEEKVIPVHEPEPILTDKVEEEVSYTPQPPSVRPTSARKQKVIKKEKEKQPEIVQKQQQMVNFNWAPTKRISIRSRAPIFHERTPAKREERIHVKQIGMRTTSDAIKEPPKGTPILLSVRPFGQMTPSHREMYELGVVNNKAKLRVGSSDTGRYRFLLLGTDIKDQNTRKSTYVRVTKKIQK